MACTLPIWWPKNSLLPLCSSKSYKFSNYDKASYKVSSNSQSAQANLFTRLFTWNSGLTNSPPLSLSQSTNKHLLKCIFSKSLTHNHANLRESYNQEIKRKAATKDIKKEDRFCMKSPTMRHNVQRVFFKFNALFLVLVFQIICKYPRSGSNIKENDYDTTFKISYLLTSGIPILP